MKDNLQNIADLIAALTVDIEEIKKKLDAKDSPDKDEALNELEEKLKPVIQFFKGNAPENINGIFGSKEAIGEYKKSVGDEMVTSLRLYNEANEEDMRKRGVPTIKEQLNDILKTLKDHVEIDSHASEKTQPKQGFMTELWQAIHPNKALNAIRLLWSKVPDGWYKNPYIWTGIVTLFVYFALSAVSWMKWHEYRDENRQLRTVADKHKVTTVMLNELHPGLAVTVGAYEKLTETVGADSTLTIFGEQVKAVKKVTMNQSQ